MPIPVEEAIENIGLVVKIAKTYRHRGVELKDLIQFGAIGLVQAAERYDECRGCKFTTYSIHWIKKEIRQGIEQTGQLIRLPTHIQRKLSHYYNCRDLGKVVGNKRSRQTMMKNAIRSKKVERTSYNMYDKDQNVLTDMIEKEEVNLVEEAIERLSYRKRDVMKCYVEGMSLKETAKRLKITTHYVNRLRNRAIAELQRSLGGEEL